MNPVNFFLPQPGKVSFFYTLVNEITWDKKLLDFYRGVISPAERRKVDRFVFQKDRDTCLVTRALVRFVLSHYTGISPATLEFFTNRYGKPGLKRNSADTAVEFNLSHSGMITACAVVLNRKIGVDVEEVNRKVSLSIADQFFSERESRYLKKCPTHLKPGVFLEFWTLKEAYIKARGMGLSIPLDKFGFDISGSDISVHFQDSIQDEPENWTFFRFSLSGLFKAAIAVHTQGKRDREIQVYKCIPFGKTEKQRSIQIPDSI